MTGNKQNGCHTNNQAAFVLHDSTPTDVARAMIEDGLQKEPFYVLSLDEVYHRILYFKKMMPRVQIFYAMKANDSEIILKLAIAMGLGFDCASPGEIDKILRLNNNPLSIIFALPTKTPEQMIFARDSGVRHTTFDTLYELHKIKQHWPDARLLIRLRVDGESIYKLGEKFGVDTEEEAIELLEEAAALGLQVVGVAFHVGSVCSSEDSHALGLRKARALFDHEARAGRGLTVLDIGGGFLSDRTDRIDQVSKLINSCLEEYFPDPNVQVVAEPGRYICDSSTVLYCSISNVRRVKKENGSVTMIYINEGLFGTLRYNEPWHTLNKFKVSKSEEDEGLENVILWGPSCDSTDRVMANCTIRLPPCTPLDWLVFSSQGAYTFGFASKFSCLPSPMTRTVISQKIWNKIKSNQLFSSSDFQVQPDLATPLPSAMPRVLPRLPTHQIAQNTLKI